MIDETEIQKLKSKYPEFFKQFPAELLDFIFSEKTASKIAEICLENQVEDEEKIEKIAYRTTLALLNQVPKENFVEILKKGAGLDINTAKKVAAQINQLIFSQASKPTPETPEPSVSRPPKRDIYREQIE